MIEIAIVAYYKHESSGGLAVDLAIVIILSNSFEKFVVNFIAGSSKNLIKSIGRYMPKSIMKPPNLGLSK
jgi:hypothetical protein